MKNKKVILIPIASTSFCQFMYLLVNAMENIQHTTRGFLTATFTGLILGIFIYSIYEVSSDNGGKDE
ncbi:MAG: hypothetical protein RIE52_12055 [Balneola sp.]